MENEEIFEIIKKNKFTEYCGIKFSQDENDNLIASVDLAEEHLNIYGMTHGGLLFTLADTTGGMNSRKFLKKPVTLNSDFHFLQNTGKGKIICTANIIHAGKHTAVLRVQVKSEKGVLLCEGTFTYFDVAK